MKNAKERFNTMLRFHNLKYANVAEITGNTPESTKAVLNSSKFPRWAKLAIWIHEEFTRRSGQEKENEV
jgi:hypothetical protein